MPIACVVPRSISFVTDAGLISTQTVFTFEGRQLPTAIECRRVATISTILQTGNVPAHFVLCNHRILDHVRQGTVITDRSGKDIGHVVLHALVP